MWQYCCKINKSGYFFIIIFFSGLNTEVRNERYFRLAVIFGGPVIIGSNSTIYHDRK